VPRSARALRVPDLDADEAAALHLAASLVRLGGAEGTAGLWKVGAAAGPEGERLAALPAHPQLGPLFDAVAHRRTATFGYRGERRVVDPYRLDLSRGRWYLLAGDHDRGAPRWFRLDRMDGSPKLGPPGGFEQPDDDVAGSVPDPWSLPVDEPVRARVAVDAVAAPVARAMLGEEAVAQEADDGAVVVEFEVSHRDGFRSFVLGFLEHAEVLGPPDLRADVVAWLEAIAGGAPDGGGR
jgi:predicted DNA-binding transcriptional regulator YafY